MTSAEARAIARRIVAQHAEPDVSDPVGLREAITDALLTAVKGEQKRCLDVVLAALRRGGR